MVASTLTSISITTDTVDETGMIYIVWTTS